MQRVICSFNLKDNIRNTFDVKVFNYVNNYTQTY